MERGRRSSGALWQQRYCLMCQPGVHVALVSCWHRQGVWPTVLIRLQRLFIFFGHGVTSSWITGRGERDNQLSPSPTVTRIVSPCLLAERMMDIWMAATIAPLPHISPQTERAERTIDIHPLAHFHPPLLCFHSFICKLKDKTYGANLQQINNNQNWLSTQDIHSESC